MVERGVSTCALAALIGCDARHLGNVIAENTKSWRVQSAINRHFKEKIFPRPSRICRRKPETIS